MVESLRYINEFNPMTIDQIISKKSMDSFKNIGKIDPVTEVEVILVSNGVKPGDIFNRFETDEKGYNEIISSLEDLETEIDDFQVDIVNEGDVVIYHNRSRVDPEVLEYFKEYKKSRINVDRGHISNWFVGEFYGIPECCREAYMQGKEFDYHPFTEHSWCKTDCSESSALVEEFKTVITAVAPERMNALRDI